MVFLFDTICDDIIEEITKDFKWTKHKWRDNKILKLERYHRLLVRDGKYKITLIYDDWKLDKVPYMYDSCYFTKNNINEDDEKWKIGYMYNNRGSSILGKYNYINLRCPNIYNKITTKKNGKIKYLYSVDRWKGDLFHEI